MLISGSQSNSILSRTFQQCGEFSIQMLRYLVPPDHFLSSHPGISKTLSYDRNCWLSPGLHGLCKTSHAWKYQSTQENIEDGFEVLNSSVDDGALAASHPGSLSSVILTQIHALRKSYGKMYLRSHSGMPTLLSLSMTS